jgi:tRNA A37 threonylcarbamoyladenosine biosynthesis protein TsaE
VSEVAKSDGTADPNAHIQKYLRAFVAGRTPSNQAIMLTGKWGAGKSYLIRRLIDDLPADDGPGYIYVSLNG